MEGGNGKMRTDICRQREFENNQRVKLFVEDFNGAHLQRKLQ